nr:GAL4 yeast regulatory protein [Naematelia aurantialba]
MVSTRDRTLPLLHPDVDPETYEYHEVPAPRALGQPPDDPGLDGMASLASSEQGVSYLGLSSGATFLNAIRRLGPKEILGVSPVGQAIANGGTELRGILSFAQGISASTEYAKPAIPPMLTPTPALPPMSEVMPLVDSYFRYFHHLTPLVHEPTVRAQIMGALPISSKPGSLVLLYMIFAMGALDLPASGIDDPGYNYYLVARQALTRDLLEEGTLPLVQGLAIMANYLQRSNRPNAGYLCLGWATRMATALGLHAPITSWRCTPLEKEMRVRVWWAVVTLEAGCSVTFGRPHGIGGVGQSAVPMPINCNDEHLTVSTMVAPPEVSHPTLYTALIIQARLARITASIHDRILSGHPAPTVEQIKRYDDRIVSVIDALPDFMQKCHDGPYRLARSVQVWRARDFRAILYRPVLLAAAWEGRPRKELSASVREAIGTCRTLALANLDDIARFVLSSPDPARGSEWYTLFFAFQASLTLLLSIVWEPNHPEAAGWRNKLVNTASWFRQLHSMRKLGTAYAQILESIVGVVPSPVEALSGSAGMQESPSGWPTLDGQQSSLDVERYWTEIWGELAPPNMNLGWDGFAPLNAQGQAQNGTGMDGWSSMLSFQ